MFVRSGLLAGAILIGGCAATSAPPSGVVELVGGVPGCARPDDISDWWLEDGDPSSDTVFIISPGGPSPQFDFAVHGRSVYRYLPDYADWRGIHLYPAHAYYEWTFARGLDMTTQDAKDSIDCSAIMMDSTVRYFKDQSKTVYVTGQSFGAFVVVDTLARFDPPADAFVVTAGRLKQNRQMVADHKAGLNGGFAEDGVTYLEPDPSFGEMSPGERGEYHVRQLLKGAIGDPDYTVLLKGRDLSNLAIFYANNDDAVGALSDEEADFLETAGAQVFETSDGHSDTLLRFIDAVMKGRLAFDKLAQE